MNFDKERATRVDLTKMDRWKALFSIPEICELFKDGRLFGKISEHILALEFDNLSLAREGGPYDLHENDTRAVEVKSFTKGGFDTSPSYMLGAGRTYNAEKHLERINFIKSKDGYYILADNTALPIVTFYPIPASDQLIFTNSRGNKTGKRTRLQAEHFIEERKYEVIDYKK